MRLTSFFFALALATAGCGSSAHLAAAPVAAARLAAHAVRPAEIQQTTPLAAYQALQAAHGSITLLDVRQPEEYTAGHAAGAMLQPLPDLATWSAKLDKHAAYMVICHSGNRSMKAATALVAAGFENITNIQGGTAAWQADGSLPMHVGPTP